MSITEQTAKHRPIKLPFIQEVVHDVFERLDAQDRGHDTGLFDLDDDLHGLHAGDMIVIGSRPSLGKTSLATRMIEGLCVDKKIPSAYLTLQTSKRCFTERLLCSRAKVDFHKFRRRLLSSAEFSRVTQTLCEIAAAPIVVHSASRITLDELSEVVSTAVEDHKVQVVVLDYVQLIEAAGDNRTEQLTRVSRRLKSLAMDLNVSLICLSQLNRGMFQPNDPRPRMEDLRGSGSLEDEADVVLLVHRDDYYHQHEPDYQPDNLAEVIIAKQRNGPTRSTWLSFTPPMMRFENLPTEL
jgi:replicative DNA helicase